MILFTILCVWLRDIIYSVPTGHQQLNFLTFFWPTPNFYWLFAARKYIFAVVIWWKINTICHFYVPYQLNYGLIYKMSKCHRNTLPNFLAFLVNDWKTEQPHHGIDSHNLEWGLHIDIYSIFLDFSWLFGEFQHFPTHIKIYRLFPDFLNFRFFLTCGNPD